MHMLEDNLIYTLAAHATLTLLRVVTCSDDYVQLVIIVGDYSDYRYWFIPLMTIGRICSNSIMLFVQQTIIMQSLNGCCKYIIQYYYY